MKKFYLILFPLILVQMVFFNTGFGQKTSKTLVVKKNETYVVGPSNSLILDTLIMEDKSTILFSPKGNGILIVKTAIIGKNCLIRSKGMTTFHGEDGGNLALTLDFHKLQSLTIDASGGDGKKGTDGQPGRDGEPDREEIYYVSEGGKQVPKTRFIPGRPAISGTSGTAGGKGGSGGNVDLTYGAKDFVVNFSHSKSGHNITILNKSGKFGTPGRNGNAGTSYGRGIIENVQSGRSHSNVKKIVDGKIILTKIERPFM